jgi:hypothetical protein
MASFVAWVDSSALERERMKRAVALFNDRDTRDELGFGSIRDTLSDALFPGTSTIQTRLRYLFFIPWLYRDLEGRRGITGARVDKEMGSLERALIEPLLASTDNDGTFGKASKQNIQRLPSSVYWSALQRWKFFQQPLTMERYHSSWDEVKARGAGQLAADDTGVPPARFQTWHPKLPKPPADFPRVASFALTRAEAEFVRGQILETCSGSLLAYAMNSGHPPIDVPFPWEAFEDLPGKLAEPLELARRFSLLAEGAALLYNVMLAQQRGPAVEGQPEWRDHSPGLAEWAKAAQGDGIATWDLGSLWSFCELRSAPVRDRSKTFLTAWQAALRDAGPAEVTESEVARRLIRAREEDLKGSGSRFTNQRALNLWGGSSGAARMNFRWGITRRLLNDFYGAFDAGSPDAGAW